jgi:hypothetical protein
MTEPDAVIPDILVVDPDVDIKLAVGLKELVTVEAARRERELQAEQKKLRRILKETEKERKELAKAADDACTSAVKEALLPPVIEAIKVLKKAGFALAAEPSLTMTPVPQDGKIRYQISVISATGTGVLRQSGSKNMTRAQKALYKKVTARNEKLEQLGEQAIRVAVDLRNVSQQERQYTAQVVEDLLSRSDQGRALLASMENMGQKLLPLAMSEDG